MERILIVEDIPDNQQVLSDALTDIYPGWSVDIASTVEEAKTKIQERIDEETPYNVCILDYKLPPKHIGEFPVGSLHLTDHVLEKLPQTLVIKITSYLDDEDFKDKRIKPMLASPNMRLRFVPKNLNQAWAQEVGDIARRRVLGDPILELMGEIFGEENPSTATGRRARSIALRGKSRSLTQSLAALQYEISRTWPYLPPDIKQKIKEKIRVDESSNPVKIAVLTPEAANKT